VESGPCCIPQALTFVVVEVVEPEFQGPDTVGKENKQGKKEKVSQFIPFILAVLQD